MMAANWKEPAHVAGLLRNRPLLNVMGADLQASTITMQIPENMPVPRGMQVLLSRDEVKALIRADDECLLLAPPAHGQYARTWGLGDVGFEVSGPGFEYTVYFRRVADRHGRGANTWWGVERRVDQHGDDWSRSLPTMVMDDFGNLVAVDGGRV